MKSPTIDDFESPSMRETPAERYLFGSWRTAAPGRPGPVSARQALARADAKEPSLLAQLTTCTAAGVIAAIVIEFVIRVVLGR